MILYFEGEDNGFQVSCPSLSTMMDSQITFYPLSITFIAKMVELMRQDLNAITKVMVIMRVKTGLLKEKDKNLEGVRLP